MTTFNQLDALVAEHVFGLPVREGPHPQMPRPPHEPEHGFWLKGKANGVEYDWAQIPRYSDDIDQAFRVVVQMERNLNGGIYEFILTQEETEVSSGWYCRFGHAEASWETDRLVRPKTAAVAICLAALRFKGVEA